MSGSEFISSAAAQRAIIADGWIPAYLAAAEEVILAAYKGVAASVRDGLSPDFAAVEEETVRLTRDVKTRFIVPMAADSYAIAQRELGAKRAARTRPIAVPLVAKQDIEDDVLLDRVHGGVASYIETTSKIEGARTALLIEAALKRAALPDETGRGRTPRQIANDLVAAGVTDSQTRARMLARTTTIWSYNSGAKLAYTDAGVREVEWLTAADDLVSEFCAPLHGKIIPISGSFFDAGSIVPGAEGGELQVPAGLPVDHPPLHPNCRCALLPVV
ncbi:MAG: phage minor head protein [Dehalococcoidia bacterium]